MRQVRHSVNIKGVEVELLFTPSLFRVLRDKGMTVSVQRTGDEREDLLAALDEYLKLIYAAAVNAWDAKRIDAPEMGVFPLKFIDFKEWQVNYPSDFSESVDACFMALKGRPLKEVVEETGDSKKKRKSSSTTTKSRPS